MAASTSGRGCEQCNCLTVDQDWLKAFGVMLCPHCKSKEPLVSKGQAKELFQLTDNDFKKLGSVTKQNPRHKDWTAMRLYLQSQVEAQACKKHGSEDGIEEHRRKRLDAKLEARAQRRAQANNAEAKEATKLACIMRKIEADAQPLQQMSGRLAGTEAQQQLITGDVEEL